MHCCPEDRAATMARERPNHVIIIIIIIIIIIMVMVVIVMIIITMDETQQLLPPEGPTPSPIWLPSPSNPVTDLVGHPRPTPSNPVQPRPTPSPIESVCGRQAMQECHAATLCSRAVQPLHTAMACKHVLQFSLGISTIDHSVCIAVQPADAFWTLRHHPL